MRFRFRSKKLERLYTEEKGARRFPPEAVTAFFEVIAVIAAAYDERDFYALKSLRFEGLAGRRGKRGEYSMRLNRQWRLIITFEEDSDGRIAVIIEIVDYH